MERGSSQPLQALLLEALGLKDLPRAGWVRAGVRQPESVAAHGWGVAWLVLALRPAHVDLARALTMAVVHDLAEVRTGDVTPMDGISREEKTTREREALRGMLAPLPSGQELLAAWEEYEAGESAEARFVKSCDRLDMALQAARIQRAEGLDLAEFFDSARAGVSDPHLAALIEVLRSR